MELQDEGSCFELAEEIVDPSQNRFGLVIDCLTVGQEIVFAWLLAPFLCLAVLVIIIWQAVEVVVLGPGFGLAARVSYFVIGCEFACALIIEHP